MDSLPVGPTIAYEASPWPDPPDLPRTAYVADAPQARRTDRLRGLVKADVVVVGGGLTGMSAALHAAEAGLRTVVLEAHEIAWGGSGRSQGQVVPALQRELSDTEKTFGVERGHRLFEAVGNGADYVFELIAKHHIDCQPVRHGTIVAAHTPEALARVARRAEFWRARGRNLEVFDELRAEELIGTKVYVGGVVDSRGGTINPLGYTRGLAAAAMARGATVYTGSPALALERVGATWTVTTPEGFAEAPWVLLCTDAHTGDLWPGLRRSIIPIRTHQLVSRPLSDNVRRTILAQGHSMADTHRMMVGLRMHPDGRLQCGGSAPQFGADVNTPFAYARKRIGAMFPQIQGLEFDYAWSGWLSMTPDKFPRFHECAPGLLAGFGYSGRGIVIGTLMGRELARCAQGASLEETVFPATPIRPVLIYPVRKPLVRTLIAYYRMRDALDAWRVRRARRRQR